MSSATVERRAGPSGRARTSSRRKPRATGWTKVRNRAIFVAVALVAIFALYMLWLRDLPIVAVKNVQISGLPTQNAGPIKRALTLTAEDMTTLHVSKGELLQAVAAYPAVKTVEVDPQLPNTLKLRVITQKPVAELASGGRQVPVAADGALLPGVGGGAASLPRLATATQASGDRIGGVKALAALRLLGAAPGGLRGQVAKVFVGAHGVTALIRNGPTVYFGSAELAAQKWFVVGRLLAEPAYRAAQYLDVTVPKHPAAGGLAGGATGVATPDAVPGQPIQPGAPATPAAPGTTPPATTPTPGAPPQPAAPTGTQQPAAPTQQQAPKAPQTAPANGGTGA